MNFRRERQKLQFEMLQQQVAQMAQQERGTRLKTAVLAQVNNELQARLGNAHAHAAEQLVWCHK